MWSSDRLTPRRSMEDMWRDITTSNLHHEMPTTAALSLHPHLHRSTAAATTATNTTSGGIILQDFFAGAIEEAPPPPAAGAPPRHLQNHRLATALSLNCERAHKSGTNSYYSHPHHPSGGNGSLAPASFLALEQQLHERFGVADAGADRRQKRMIKNRETAARSRARKQAYTTELELEVSHLVKENSKLKREYEELRMAMATQASTKGTLQRTSTAPF